MLCSSRLHLSIVVEQCRVVFPAPPVESGSRPTFTGSVSDRLGRNLRPSLFWGTLALSPSWAPSSPGLLACLLVAPPGSWRCAERTANLLAMWIHMCSLAGAELPEHHWWWRLWKTAKTQPQRTGTWKCSRYCFLIGQVDTPTRVPDLEWTRRWLCVPFIFWAVCIFSIL